MKRTFFRHGASSRYVQHTTYTHWLYDIHARISFFFVTSITVLFSHNEDEGAGGGSGVSCSSFGVSNPGLSPIERAFVRVEGGPAGDNSSG
jgi:hypothetical protein